jgi:MFS family permease
MRSRRNARHDSSSQPSLASGWIGDRVGTKRTFLFALLVWTRRWPRSGEPIALTIRDADAAATMVLPGPAGTESAIAGRSRELR